MQYNKTMCLHRLIIEEKYVNTTYIFTACLENAIYTQTKNQDNVTTRPKEYGPLQI